jgi:hypothetical protein
MTASSAAGMGVPSPNDLMEKIRKKVKGHEQVIWPQVIEKMDHLRALKAERSKKAPDLEYRTVAHLDLERALVRGTVVDVGSASVPEEGWVVTVKGLDSFDEELIVMVHCCSVNSRPLHITDFTIPQKKG